MISFKKWAMRLAVPSFFMALGFSLCLLIPQEKCPGCLPEPGLPEPYRKYDVHRIDDANRIVHRNFYIQQFYQAWKKKTPYAICEQGFGIDTPMTVFWITDQGNLTCILVDHLNFRSFGKKLYRIYSVKSISLYDWGNPDGESDKIPVEPNTITCYDLLIKADKGCAEDCSKFLWDGKPGTTIKLLPIDKKFGETK